MTMETELAQEKIARLKTAIQRMLPQAPSVNRSARSLVVTQAGCCAQSNKSHLAAGNGYCVSSFQFNTLTFVVNACAVAACGLFSAFLFENPIWMPHVWKGDLGGLFGTFDWGSGSGEYFLAYFVTILVVAIWMLVSHNYRVASGSGNSGPPSQAVRAVEVCIGMLGVAVLLGWLSLKAVSPMPRFAESWLLSWWVLGSAALLLVHHLEFRLLRKLVTAGRLVDETVAVVGSGPEAVIIVAKLLAVPGIALAGVFDDRRARAPQEVLGVPVRGGIADLAAALREIDRIIITFPLTASRRIGEVVKRLSLFPVDIGLAVDIAAGAFEARGGTRYGTFVVDLVHPGLTDLRHLVKRVEDIILASILVVLFTPLLLVIAIAIKLDSPGPVLFRQPRQGQGGQVFQMLKFRTMYISATDVFGDRLTEVDDQRITRFGRLLRKSSLDELPQLFNVLRGDMSVVGPRPHALRAKVADVPYADAVETYAIRLRMKPGITGWAQVNGWRGETHTVEQLRKRVIHDLDYMNNWSIWWDLYIIGRTAFQILFFFSNNALVRNAL